MKKLIAELPAEKRRVILSMPEAPKKILDVGCGLGAFTYSMSVLYPGSRVVGVDADKDYVDKARGKYQNSNLQFKHCNIIDFDEGGFDVVVFSEVIEHLPNVGINLNKINAMTAIGGTLFVTTDSAFYLESFLANFKHSLIKKTFPLYLWHEQDRYYWWAHHLYSWTPAALATILNLYGFKMSYYWYTNHYDKGIGFRHKVIDIITTFIPAFRRKIVLKLTKFGKPTIVEGSLN